MAQNDGPPAYSLPIHAAEQLRAAGRELALAGDHAAALPNYPEAAAEIQDLYLAGRKAEAIAAVPDALVDQVALCGPADRVRDRLGIWKDAGAGQAATKHCVLQNVADSVGLRAPPGLAGRRPAGSGSAAASWRLSCDPEVNGCRWSIASWR